jgi:hypothetical protein
MERGTRNKEQGKLSQHPASSEFRPVYNIPSARVQENPKNAASSPPPMIFLDFTQPSAESFDRRGCL